MEDAVETAQKSQEEAIEEARGYLLSGEGPEDRPWVDLSVSMWQDYYAGTRVHREPGGLAGISAGSVDHAPVTFQVSRRADPSSGGGSRIENPELAVGTVDLVFVVSILSPLLLGVLGLGIGGREREERIDRLIVVQSGEVQGWLLARLLSVTLVVAASNIGLCLLAGFLGGGSTGEVGVLVGLGLAYAVLWGGLLAVVSAGAKSVRAAALSFGAVWMIVCIVLPSVAAEVGLARVQTDFGVAETLEARTVSYEAYEMADEDASAELYRRYPELLELPAALDEELYPGALRHLTDAVLVAAKSERINARQRETESAQSFSQRAAWASPAIALTVAFERLAGVGPEAASAFQSYAMDAVDARVGWVLTKAWSKAPLGPADFEALLEEAPEAFLWEPDGVLSPSVAIFTWGLSSWLFAIVGLRRSERGLRAMG